MRPVAIVLCALIALVAAPAARAHEMRPAYLEITQDAPRHYAITFKQPVQGEIALRLTPRLSNGWLDAPPADQFATTSFLIRTWSVASADSDPLSQRALAIDGLDATITDVLVRVTLADGRRLETILRPGSAQMTLTFDAHAGLPAPAYLRLGVEHILTGADHLMFVLGLLLLVGIRWRLIKAITAFTIAHSLTLAASATGLVTAPSAAVEALVALSIVFVALELVRAARGAHGLTHRYPWVIAFVFGLLHGFAFAGALAEVGLPKGAVPAALFLFNVGVEIGQLLFVAVAIAAILIIRRLTAPLPRSWGLIAARAPAYVIGGWATFWFIERASLAFL